MSDLISRSALLKKFDDTGIQITFDLPVEEILGEDVDIDDFTMLVQDAIRAYKKLVLGTIKDMPTAYDVDAVVQELEESTVCGMFGAMFGKSDTEIIDIIRKGGVKRDFLLGSYNR